MKGRKGQGVLCVSASLRGKNEEGSRRDAETQREEGEGVLPEGWAQATLQDIADVVGGVTKGQKRRGGERLRSVPYLRVANVQKGYLDLREIKEIEATPEDIAELSLKRGDILLIEGGNREHLGRGWIWEGQIGTCIHQNHVFRARLRDLRWEPRFFSWYMNEVCQAYFFAEASQTVNLASVNLPTLRAVSVAVPPLAEQKRIVAKVEELLGRVKSVRERLAKVPGILKRFRQAVLMAACSGRLTEDWRERQSPLSGAPAHSGELPKPWHWAPFESLTDNHDGRRIPVKSADREKRRGQYLYYGASGPIDTIDDYLFDGEYLLIGEDGANLLSRSTPIAFRASGRFWVNNHAHIVRAKPEVSLAYLELYVNSIDLQEYVTGTAQPKLTQAALNRIPVPVPPCSEQTETVHRVEALFELADAIEKRVAAATARADKLTQSILAKAFRGELVPTEAELARAEGREYEPAAVLLEKVRKAKDEGGRMKGEKGKRRGRGIGAG